MTADPDARPHPVVFAMTALGFVAYFMALHLLIASHAMPLLALVVVVAPWIVAVVSLPWRSSHFAPHVMQRTAMSIVLLTIIATIGWRYAAPLAEHAELALYLENLAFMGLSSAMFATSLVRGREALITRLARRMRNGDMPPPVVAYTRLATIAWAMFFAAMAIVSTALFLAGSRTVWSAFVNLATWPLAAAMFALEYLVRLRVLRDYPHGSLMTGFHAFRAHARDTSTEGRSR